MESKVTKYPANLWLAHSALKNVTSVCEQRFPGFVCAEVVGNDMYGYEIEVTMTELPIDDSNPLKPTQSRNIPDHIDGVPVIIKIISKGR